MVGVQKLASSFMYHLNNTHFILQLFELVFLCFVRMLRDLF